MKKFITYLQEKKIQQLINPRATSRPEDKPFPKTEIVSNQSVSIEPKPAAPAPVAQPEVAAPRPQSKVISMKGNTIVSSSPGTPAVVQPSRSEPVRRESQTQQASPIYTVGKNESLKSIAHKHGVSEKDLMDLNRGIKDPNTVQPGTKIRTRK